MISNHKRWWRGLIRKLFVILFSTFRKDLGRSVMKHYIRRSTVVGKKCAHMVQKMTAGLVL